MNKIKQEVENKIKEEERNGENAESFPISNIVATELEYYLKRSREESFYLPLEVIGDIINRVLAPEEVDKLVEVLQTLLDYQPPEDIEILMS